MFRISFAADDWPSVFNEKRTEANKFNGDNRWSTMNFISLRPNRVFRQLLAMFRWSKSTQHDCEVMTQSIGPELLHSMNIRRRLDDKSPSQMLSRRFVNGFLELKIASVSCIRIASEHLRVKRSRLNVSWRGCERRIGCQWAIPNSKASDFLTKIKLEISQLTLSLNPLSFLPRFKDGARITLVLFPRKSMVCGASTKTGVCLGCVEQCRHQHNHRWPHIDCKNHWHTHTRCVLRYRASDITADDNDDNDNGDDDKEIFPNVIYLLYLEPVPVSQLLLLRWLLVRSILIVVLLLS